MGFAYFISDTQYRQSKVTRLLLYISFCVCVCVCVGVFQCQIPSPRSTSGLHIYFYWSNRPIFTNPPPAQDTEQTSALWWAGLACEINTLQFLLQRRLHFWRHGSTTKQSAINVSKPPYQTKTENTTVIIEMYVAVILLLRVRLGVEIWLHYLGRLLLWPASIIIKIPKHFIYPRGELFCLDTVLVQKGKKSQSTRNLKKYIFIYYIYIYFLPHVLGLQVCCSFCLMCSRILFVGGEKQI